MLWIEAVKAMPEEDGKYLVSGTYDVPGDDCDAKDQWEILAWLIHGKWILPEQNMVPVYWSTYNSAPMIFDE